MFFLFFLIFHIPLLYFSLQLGLGRLLLLHRLRDDAPLDLARRRLGHDFGEVDL